MAEKNPVSTFLTEREKNAARRAEQDLNMWQAWDQGGRKADDLKPLLKRYNSLFNRKTREWKAPAVSPEAFKGELQKHFIRAVKTYDPNRGAALNTHVQHRLQKAKRFNARYQNVGYIPEGQARYIGKIDRATNEFQEQGINPSSAQLARRVNEMEQADGRTANLTGAKITRIQTARRKDVPSSAFETDPTSMSMVREQDVIRLMQRRPNEYFNKDEAQVFNHIYGTKGHRKITSTKDLAKQIGTSQSRISRLKTSIGKKIKSNL
jgi:DNA-directed RNA polymerase specialized sigma subunit